MFNQRHACNERGIKLITNTIAHMVCMKMSSQQLIKPQMYDCRSYPEAFMVVMPELFKQNNILFYFASLFLPLYKTLCFSQQPLGQCLHCHWLFDYFLVPHDDAVPGWKEFKGHVPHSGYQDSKKKKCYQEPQANFKEATHTDTHLKMHTLNKTTAAQYKVRYRIIQMLMKLTT